MSLSLTGIMLGGFLQIMGAEGAVLFLGMV